jgi:hypothetical protein
MEGFLMSTAEHAAHTDPEFFPENVEFLGFICGWDCYVGVDTVHTLFYLIRTKDRDWLETVVKYSNRIISRSCVMIHVIAVSIGHRGYDPVIAMSLRAKKQIRNPGHTSPTLESAHRLPIEFERARGRSAALIRRHVFHSSGLIIRSGRMWTGPNLPV